MRKRVQLRKGDPGGGTSQGERRALNSHGGRGAEGQERQVCGKRSRRLAPATGPPLSKPTAG